MDKYNYIFFNVLFREFIECERLIVVSVQGIVLNRGLFFLYALAVFVQTHFNVWVWKITN